MEEQVYEAFWSIIKPTEVENIESNDETILADRDHDDISLFFPSTLFTESTLNSIRSNDSQPIPHDQIDYIKGIQKFLSKLAMPVHWASTNEEINNIVNGDIYNWLKCQNRNVIDNMKEYTTDKQQLKLSLAKKVEHDNDLSIFAKPFMPIQNTSLDMSTRSSDSIQPVQQQRCNHLNQQLAYFAIQSLSSILCMLFKSAEKNDPTLIHQIVCLASQLCEQLPMKCLSSSNVNTLLFQSLKPMINYIYDLSLTDDSILAKQAKMILLTFFIAKGSFKDLLPHLCTLIFDTTNIYQVHAICVQLNNGLKETLEQRETNRSNIDECKLMVTSMLIHIDIVFVLHYRLKRTEKRE
jgi:hypothetical protein